MAAELHVVAGQRERSVGPWVPQCTLVHCALEYEVRRWRGSADRAWAALAEHRGRADTASEMMIAERRLKHDALTKGSEWHALAVDGEEMIRQLLSALGFVSAQRDELAGRRAA